MPDNNIISLLQDDTNDPCLYQYYNQLHNHRTVVFNSIVDENLLETVILPLKEFEEDDIAAPVTLIINSAGGSVLDGLVLVNIIDNYKKKLNIIAYGYVASMGAIIMCAGKDNPNVTKYCHQFTIGLFHDGYTCVEGESGSVEDTIAFNRRIDEMVKSYVVAHTNFTEEEYDKNIHRHQLYLTAQELLEKGVVDEII